MSIVNFAIPAPLAKRVEEAIKQKGFASKAEFFRFAAVYFLDIIDKPFASEDDRFDFLVDELNKEIGKTYKGKKLPTLKEQLKEI